MIFAVCHRGYRTCFYIVKNEAAFIQKRFRCYPYEAAHQVLPATISKILQTGLNMKFGWRTDPPVLVQVFKSSKELHAFSLNPMLPIPVWYEARGFELKQCPLTKDIAEYERYLADVKQYAIRHSLDPDDMTPTDEFLSLCEDLNWGDGNARQASDGLGISVQSVSGLKTGKHQPSTLMLRYMRLLVRLED